MPPASEMEGWASGQRERGVQKPGCDKPTASPQIPQTRDVLSIELGTTENALQGNRWQRQAALKGPCEPAPGAQVARWGRAAPCLSGASCATHSDYWVT